jgi:hypothetical protein
MVRSAAEPPSASRRLGSSRRLTPASLIKLNPDRLLTIYIQADPPSETKRSNWLPWPKAADFSLCIRAYGLNVGLRGAAEVAGAKLPKEC